MKQLSKLYSNLYGESLYRNSFYLMASTAVMSGFGFIFWTLNARLYPTEQVGLATTMISAAALISGLGYMGLGNGLIRFLPASDRKNNKINTALTLSTIVTLIIAVIYVAGISIFSPALKVLQNNPLTTLLFIGSTAVITIGGIVDSVFIANRSAGYVLVKNTLFSLIKITLPALLVGFGAFGIYGAYGTALTAAVLLSLVFLIQKLNFSIKPMVDLSVVKKILRFSFGSFAAGFIGGLPGITLPILITNNLGPRFSAYFYMDLMIANMLFIVPSAVAQSLFAEGSHNEAGLESQLKKAMGMILIILVPAVLLVLLFGKYILLAFGPEYSTEGLGLLNLFSLSTIFISVNSIGSTILYIRHKIKVLILINTIGTAVILGLGMALSSMGLFGVGIGWIAGHAVMAGIYLIRIAERVRQQVGSTLISRKI